MLHRRHASCAVWAAVLMASFMLAAPGGTVLADTPPWAEPRAINVVDLAGQVPDDALAGHIVCYGNPGGLITYESSRWERNKLLIRVKMYPRFHWVNDSVRWASAVATLGHKPVGDRISSSAPKTWLRLYDGSRDVTDEVVYFDYADPGLALPSAPGGGPRYETASHITSVTQPISQDGIYLPANWGGYLVLHARYEELTSVFTVIPSARPLVTYLGEETLSYSSYIGPGFVGWFEPLMSQMRARYEDRHARISLDRPEGANYVMFVYDPMPFDLDSGFWAQDADLFAQNRGQPIAGTVRLAADGGMLSQDLNHAGAFPLNAWWQDADQSAGPYLSTFTIPIDRITPPEFVVLPGTLYDPCFVDGGCGVAVMAGIYASRATLKVVYLDVQPRVQGELALPLRVADTNWTPAVVPRHSAPSVVGQQTSMFIPFITTQPEGQIIPEERPVGFFDPISGRVIGYWAE